MTTDNFDSKKGYWLASPYTLAAKFAFELVTVIAGILIALFENSIQRYSSSISN
ncbi:MAG TPA: hypothetical protein VFZ52_14870 [Chryseolinea sp.]